MTPIDLRFSELQATAEIDDGVLALKLAGTADATSEAALTTLLTHLHAELVQVVAREARVDLRNLEFMNSSCFKAFITWILAVDKASQRYPIRFLCNPAFHWQKRSLRALVNFGGDIVSVA